MRIPAEKMFLHDEGQLSPVNPKNFYQVALVVRALASPLFHT